ncbi:MAG: hypothetical protein LJE57_02670 [Gallionella sp.]|nr:hypothetical protein [Gallionella sp.]
MQDRRHETAQGLEYGLGMLVTGWFAKNLGDAMLATEALDQIRSTYAAVYEEAGARLSAAVFIRHESEGRLHCEVMAYFSPEAFRLAEAFDAVPCRKPSPGDLSLHAGPEDCWNLFETARKPQQ